MVLRRMPPCLANVGNKMGAQVNALPKTGEKLWGHHELRGTVMGILGDDKDEVIVVRFWFKHKRRWHYECVPTWMWGMDYCPISRENKR